MYQFSFCQIDILQQTANKLAIQNTQGLNQNLLCIPERSDGSLFLMHWNPDFFGSQPLSVVTKNNDLNDRKILIATTQQKPECLLHL